MITNKKVFTVVPRIRAAVFDQLDTTWVRDLLEFSNFDLVDDYWRGWIIRSIFDDDEYHPVKDGDVVVLTGGKIAVMGMSEFNRDYQEV